MCSKNRRPGYKEKKLITGNVRTLFKTGVLLSLLCQLKEYKLAKRALQEKVLQGKDIMNMKHTHTHTHTHFYSGKEEGIIKCGVAFIVERNMKRNVLDFKAVDKRLCVLRINTKFQNISFINVHAATQEKEELEKEAFCQEVERVCDSCPSSVINKVLGEWNAKVGREEIYQGITGRHSMHLNTNDNGQRLADFAAAKNMVASATCFPHKEIHEQTWRSPDGKNYNQIDHILIDKRKATGMLDAKTCRGASSDSDHFLFRGKYRSKIAYSKYEPKKTTRRFHVGALRKSSMARRFQLHLDKEFGRLETEG
jgi:endonuclease/exonuclease/phosphatase family metal-dependent hydrolase